MATHGHASPSPLPHSSSSISPADAPKSHRRRRRSRDSISTIHVSTPDASPQRAGAGAMDSNPNPPYSPYPSTYTKFHTALNAGLLNPMTSPPARPSPTLFDMMANEQEYHPRGVHAVPSPAGAMPPPPLPRALDRQSLLNDRVNDLVGNCSPGSQFNNADTSDVRLTLTSKDGLTVSLGVHRNILVAHSRFFAAKLSDRWSRQQRSLPHIVEISDCDDVEVYVETVRLMYCRDLRRRLMREDVTKVLGILKVSAAIVFDAGVVSCLEYLEAAPWAEDDDEKVAALLGQLHLSCSGAGEVLKRMSLESATSSAGCNGNAGGESEDGAVDNGSSTGSGEDVLVRLLQVVLEGKDEKARREMKGLVSKMLRENSNGCRSSGHGDLKKESLYAACERCLCLLRDCFERAARGDLEDVVQIARQADNLHWMLDVLVERLIAQDFLRLWAAQAQLAGMHSQVPAIHRYEVSRVTARLFVGIGKGQILVSKEWRCRLLATWLEPFYEDFGWMRRACRGLDRHSMEDGLANTILTLPLAAQQEILLNWFHRFLNTGEDCPNIQRGFEVWWRRAFWRRNADPEQPPRLRITAVCDNS